MIHNTYHFKADHPQENFTTMLLSLFLAFCLSGFAASTQINEIQTAGKRANVMQQKSGKFVLHFTNERAQVLDPESRFKIKNLMVTELFTYS